MKNSKLLIYDGTIEGFLTTVFKIYEEKLEVMEIIACGATQNNLFSEEIEVISEEQKAKRVLRAIKQKTSKAGFTRFQWAFLSEETGIELKLFRMIRYILKGKELMDEDYSHPAVLEISEIAKKVGREKHRMEAFVRFRLTRDNIYFAIIEPDFNVLPLIKQHFKERYADQKWLIYDNKRKFGVFYDKTKLQYISLNIPEDIGITGANPEYFEETEIRFQSLWKAYFKSTNIKTRVNMRLHIQHVPRRYWKYLSEKSPFA